MPTLALDLRDLLWFASLLATVILAYGRLRSEIRHLDDTKAERKELYAVAEDIRARLDDIRTSVTRLEEALRVRLSVPSDRGPDDP